MRFIFFLFCVVSPAWTQSFTLCDVEKAKTPLISVNQEYLLKTLYGPYVQAYGPSDKKLVPTNIHPFIYAAHKAYAEHRPLIISPDGIWMLITQGHATYKFKNNKISDVKIQDLSVIPETNDEWLKPLEDLTAKTENGLGNISFSTTDINIQTAQKISKFSTKSEYFDISLFSLCGIPEIRLEGKSSDWERILNQLESLRNSGMTEWADSLEPLLKEFFNASNGKVNKKFWNSFYKFNTECGDGQITGWILNFFPYTNKGIKRQFVKFNELQSMKRVEHSDPNISFPSGRNYIPFKAKGKLMRYEAGFMGVSQDPQSLALKAEINWAVVSLKATGQLSVWQQNVVREGAIGKKKLNAAYSATYIDINSFIDEKDNGLQGLQLLEYAIVKKPVSGAFLKDLISLPNFKSLECHDWNIDKKYLPYISKLKNTQFIFNKPISSNFFKYLPPTSRELIFSGIRIEADYFKKLANSSIEKIVIENCTFSPEAFDELKSLSKTLKVLTIEKCPSITASELSKLNKLKSLKELSVNSCKLTSFPKLDIASLRSLDLSTNQLTSIEFINNLSGLVRLKANSNFIQGNLSISVPEKIEEVILHHNQISKVEFNLKHLRKLDISSNLLVDFPNISNCPLSELKIEKNKIQNSAIPDFLSKSLVSLSLEEVKLSRSNIREISKMNELRVLSLKNCSLENGDIPEICKLENLQTLRLWTNRSLTDECKHEIIKLFLDGKSISIFDCGFSSSTMDEFAKLREKLKVN